MLCLDWNILETNASKLGLIDEIHLQVYLIPYVSIRLRSVGKKWDFKIGIHIGIEACTVQEVMVEPVESWPVDGISKLSYSKCVVGMQFQQLKMSARMKLRNICLPFTSETLMLNLAALWATLSPSPGNEKHLKSYLLHCMEYC